MGYERYPRGTNPQGDYYGRGETQDYGRDYGSGRSYSASSARDYQAAGAFDRDDDRQSYGQREYGNSGYARQYRDNERGQGRDEQRSYGARDSYGDSRYGNDRGNYGAQRYGQSGSGQSGFGQSSYGQSNYGQSNYGQSGYGSGGSEYHGSYASDGRRFEDVGSRRDWDDDDRGRGRDYGRQGGGRSYGRAPQGYDYDERGFFARAGDEVRSWFGDEDAERRREADGRYDERYYNQQGRYDRDSDYHSWRSGQIAALDRDYDEYRQENRSRFENEFSTFRNERQTQRSALSKVQEHDEVLGSDGSHVGTVDKVRGDRILLTKNDADAGGQHHSIPSRWISTVEDKKVTLSKTAEEAKQHWRTEENNQAMFGYGDRGSTGNRDTNDRNNNDRDSSTTNLNRSFSGTY